MPPTEGSGVIQLVISWGKQREVGDPSQGHPPTSGPQTPNCFPGKCGWGPLKVDSTTKEVSTGTLSADKAQSELSERNQGVEVWDVFPLPFVCCLRQHAACEIRGYLK